MCTPRPVRALRYTGKVAAKRFALAGFHFSYFALMQDYPTDKLHVKMPHPECPDRSLTDKSKRFRKQIVDSSPRSKLDL